jgi:hypothetical protein
MKSETQVQREICDWLRTQPLLFWRQNNIPVFGRSLPKDTPRGLPDIFIVCAGKIYGIEVKRPAGENGERENSGRLVRKGLLTPAQADFAWKFEDCGGIYHCVHSLDELRRVLFVA